MTKLCRPLKYALNSKFWDPFSQPRVVVIQGLSKPQTAELVFLMAIDNNAKMVPTQKLELVPLRQPALRAFNCSSSHIIQLCWRHGCYEVQLDIVVVKFLHWRGDLSSNPTVESKKCSDVYQAHASFDGGTLSSVALCAGEYIFYPIAVVLPIGRSSGENWRHFLPRDVTKPMTSWPHGCDTGFLSGSTLASAPRQFKLLLKTSSRRCPLMAFSKRNTIPETMVF